MLKYKTCENNPMKRYAALTSLALVLGAIVALPAKATGTPVNLITSATAITTPGTTATQIAGPGNIVTVSNTVISGGGAKSIYYTVSGGVTSSGTTSGTLAPGAGVFISTPTPGTITVWGYEITNGAASTSPTDTIVITVITSLPGTVYASSQVYAAPSTGLPTPATDAAFSVTAPSGTSNVANFTVAEFDGSGNAMLAANAKPITILATNALVSSPNLAASPTANTTYIAATPINPITDFIISGIPGYGGASTVAVQVNGVLVKTYTIKFTGNPAKLVLTAVNSTIGVGNATAILPNVFNPIGITANVNALEVQEFDAQNNLLAVTPAHISITPASATIATPGALDGVGNYTLGNIKSGVPTSSTALGVSLNGVAAGTTTFTATDTSIGLVSAPVTIRVSGAVPTSVKMVADAPNYAKGALGTLFTQLSDSAGPLPAGTYAVFTAQAVASIALSAGTQLLPGAPVAITGTPTPKLGLVTVNNQGIYSFSFNAPVTDANVTITATPLNNSITVTPATFISGAGVTGPAVADPASLAESDNATNAATDVATLTGGQADSADQAAQALTAQATTVQSLINSLSALISTTLATLGADGVALAKIKTKIKK
jgi:hypothetical protein